MENTIEILLGKLYMELQLYTLLFYSCSLVYIHFECTTLNSLFFCSNSKYVTLSAKSSLILGENKAAFCIEGHNYIYNALNETGKPGSLFTNKFGNKLLHPLQVNLCISAHKDKD